MQTLGRCRRGSYKTKSGGHSLKGLCKESSHAEKKPYLQTSIQQTTIDVNGNCDIHPTRSDPYPPVILLGPPLSYLLAFQTRTAQCVSCLQIECFYRDSFHCDFLPYDIDTIQANLLSQLSCISCPSTPCMSRDAFSSLSIRRATFSVCRNPAPLFYPPWRLHSPGL